MSNSRNWVSQKNCTYSAGNLDVSGNEPASDGDATFTQAFGAGPITVSWSVQDSSVPKKSMAGTSQLSAGLIDAGTPTSTFDGTTYSNSPGGPIALTNPCVVTCTVNAKEYDSKVVGPGSATNNAVPSFDGATGKLLKNTSILFGQIVTLNFSSQFTALTEKPTPVDDDLLLIEDSADSGSKKKVRFSQLPSGGGGGHTIADEGTPLPSQSTLNFVGDGVTATNGTGETIVTIPGGSGGGASELSDLSDVTSATQTNGFVLASSGAAYVGRSLVNNDMPTDVLKTEDVYDSPQFGITIYPISANWAAEHQGASNPHNTTPADIGACTVFYQSADPLAGANYGDIWVLSP